MARSFAGVAWVACSFIACGSSPSGGPGTKTQTETETGDGTGTETESDDGSDDEMTDEETGTEDGPKFDLNEMPDIAGECLACEIVLETQASNTFVPIDGNEFLGHAELFDEIVYAIDEVGEGRVAYTADMTNVFFNEMTQCPLWPWLGATGQDLPRVLATGGHMCDAQDWNNLGELPDFTYAAVLPAQYVGDPEALRADYDLVMYCDERTSFPQAVDAQTYVEYAAVHGGGLYIGSDYYEPNWPTASLDELNAIAEPLGVEFAADQLDWGNAEAGVAFDCFPDPAG